MSRRQNWDDCGICGERVGRKGPWRYRLARPSGGYDHSWCSLEMQAEDFKELDRSGDPRTSSTPRSKQTVAGWVDILEIEGGWIVKCRLCGKEVKRSFWVSDTNHAEALRLATAWESRHRSSQMHAAAVNAFHNDPSLGDEDKHERIMRELFGGKELGPLDVRRRAAVRAASAVRRKGVGMVDE